MNTKIPSHDWLAELQQDAFESHNTVLEDYKTSPKSAKDVRNLITNFLKLHNSLEQITLSVQINDKSLSTSTSPSNLLVKIIDALKSLSSILHDLPSHPIIDFNNHGTHPIDEIIRRELFATRMGSRIYWDVREGRVFYDFQTGKLSIVSPDGI